MRKTLMLLLVGSVGIISGYAHPFTGQDGKETTSQMGSIGDTSMGRPRAPRRSPSFQIYYDPGLNAVLVSSTSDVGLVHAVIENLSTSSFYTYSFDSSELAVLPVSGEADVWMVLLYSSCGLVGCWYIESQ